MEAVDIDAAVRMVGALDMDRTATGVVPRGSAVALPCARVRW